MDTPQTREPPDTREVRPIGGYLPMDAGGHVVREASMAHVVPPCRRQCRALMKVMIRAGFELVMAAEQRYTTGLSWCQRSFARHHPDQAAAMERALFLYPNPSRDTGAVLALARDLGAWLLAAAGR